MDVGVIHCGGARAVAGLREQAARERRWLIAQFSQVRGLMPLLVGRRTHQRWSREERQLLKSHLKQISWLTPHLVLFALPGGFLALPVLAWWLERCRGSRAP